MAKQSNAIKIFIILLAVSAIAVLADRARACSSCNTQYIMISQNDQNMSGAQGQSDHTRYAISPVSHVRIQITKGTPYTLYKDRMLYFASEEEKAQFLQDPQKYLQRPPVVQPVQHNKKTQSSSGNSSSY